MSFPAELLRPTDSALCLFCAAFGGQQDAAFLRAAGLTDVLCVDKDRAAIVRMQPQYPASWGYLPMDVFRYLSGEEFGCVDGAKLWPPAVVDVVTADPWSGDMDVKLRGYLPQFLALTRRVLILGCGTPWTDETLEKLTLLGERPRVLPRTASACWIVVERG